MTRENDVDPTGGERAHQTAGTDGEDLGRPRITALLRQDHRHVNALFDAYGASAPEDHDKRLGIIRELRHALAVHSLAEEEIFYRALESHPECGKLLLASRRAHDEFEKLLAELEEAEGYDRDEIFQFLVADVRHHIIEEEGVMFDLARRFLSNEALQELGALFRRSKEAVREQLGIADPQMQRTG